MKLRNKSEAFELTYDGQDIFVPGGEFEVDEALGNHIIYIALKWGKEIESIKEETKAKRLRIRRLSSEEKKEVAEDEEIEAEKIEEDKSGKEDVQDKIRETFKRK